MEKMFKWTANAHNLRFVSLRYFNACGAHPNGRIGETHNPETHLIPLMMAFTALAALGQGPWQGDMNAVIASCSEYTYLTQGKRVDGTMYSCNSLGVKIGGGIGTAVVGWLLELSGYVGTHAVQPQSALNMMQFMYLWLPLIFDVLIMFILSRMNVEETNAKIKKEKEMVLW